MRIIEKDVMPDGTSIQMEDWSKDYPGTYASEATIAAYPMAKRNVGGIFGPRTGELFRCAMNFHSYVQAREAFNLLSVGEKDLLDYTEFFSRPEHAGALI